MRNTRQFCSGCEGFEAYLTCSGSRPAWSQPRRVFLPKAGLANYVVMRALICRSISWNPSTIMAR